jgi:2-polyprenyl-3-methyl-5-hydroxy-6-metoxy-1,4-benzoquinol methylase
VKSRSDGRKSIQQTLAVRYQSHNLKRGRGFVYGGIERVGALRRFIRGRIHLALDLGCRDGALVELLAIPNLSVIGVDIDLTALKSADERHVLRPCCADLWKPTIPFRSNSFDLVVAGEILEHVPFPDQLVAEIARVLRPGGSVVGSVPNSFRLKNRLLFLAGRWFEGDPTHLRQFSPESLRSLLADRFSSVEIRPCVGRYAALWPRMFANDLIWRAQ